MTIVFTHTQNVHELYIHLSPQPSKRICPNGIANMYVIMCANRMFGENLLIWPKVYLIVTVLLFCNRFGYHQLHLPKVTNLGSIWEVLTIVWWIFELLKVEIPQV